MAVRVQRAREDRDESLRLIQCLVIIQDFKAILRFGAERSFSY